MKSELRNELTLELQNFELSFSSFSPCKSWPGMAHFSVRKLLRMGQSHCSILRFMQRLHESCSRPTLECETMQCYMVTGDAWTTARIVAEQLGIEYVMAEVLPAGKAEKVHTQYFCPSLTLMKTVQRVSPVWHT